MISVKSVSKNFGDVKVLKSVSCDIKKGERVVIIGPSGSGKSTLMNLITDNVKRNEGQILWDGTDILKLGKRFRGMLGYMPQQQGMYNDFSARAFLRYMAQIKEIPKKQADEQIEQLLDVVNLREDAHKKVGGFSGGMRQRVLLAQALLGDPEILILDDSASALDYATDAALRTAIRNMPDAPTTFIVSQRAASVRYADHIIVLDDGIIAGQGTHDSLLESCAVYQEIYYSQFPREVNSHG